MTRPVISRAWLLMLCGLAALRAHGQSGAVSFNLSTAKTFAPGEQPTIHLYTRNVDALEFRIYRVNDPVRFIENLRELHSFGPEAGPLDRERIDERTWLERFHDWKSGLWSRVRSFFRSQFSWEARGRLRARQSAITRRSRVVSEAEFAQIPILNQSQLVARWRQLVPSTYISDSNELPLRKLDAGLYLLEATDGRFKAYTLVMVTEMALVTRVTSSGVLGYVVDRMTGEPIAGATVEAGFGQQPAATAVTDREGVAQLPVGSGDHSAQDNFWVVASKGREFAAATPGIWALSYSQAGKYVGYVFTERPVYRPMHTVHWKAILREHNGNALALPRAGMVHVAIHDESDKAVFDQQMPLSAAGDVAGDFTLPKDANLGYYSLRIGDDQDAVAGGFHVEDYRKPDYRVQVSAGQQRVLAGKTMPITIDSRYFFGEPVANAKVKYRVYHERHPWWGETDEDNASQSSDTATESDAETEAATADAGDQESEQTGRLNAEGTLTIQVPTLVDTRGFEHPDLDYTVEAGVTDAADREITGRGRFLATYGTFRVDVEPVSYAVRAGEAAKFRVTAVDYDNRPVSTRVHVQLVFHKYADGKTESVNGAAVDVTTDASGHAIGELATGKPPGSSADLQVTAAAVQPGTRNPVSESYLWIMGAGEEGFNESSGSAQIVADKKTYAPGDIAHLSLVSENPGFTALVLAEGYTLQKREVMHGHGRTLSFDLPITADSQPNVTVSALFLKDNTLYQASKVLRVPPTQQQLQVEITPAKEIFQPQAAATYDLKTSDAKGKPVSADLSFGVVDEAIYSLYPDTSGDMLRRLYPQRSVEAQVDSSLEYYFSGEAGVKSPMLAMRNARYRPQLAQVKPGNEAKPKVRKAFPDTAYWAATVHTDAAGHARVSFSYPDSLTTWRATVHAITATSQAGSAISRVLVRKDVLVRMGIPRFLVKGDELTLPVIVHNYLPDAKQARLGLTVGGLETVSGPVNGTVSGPLSGTGGSVTVPSKGEATALWQLKATQVGTAKLTASAITGTESDALELSFPVEPEGVARNLAGSGVLAGTTAQAAVGLTFPGNTDPAAHTLRVEASSSIAGSLFSALGYLTSFPYGCTEQTMSSYLPNAIVAETMQRLKVGGRVDPADLRAKMQDGLARLKDYQHEDGGWGWWKEDASRVYMTAYVVSGLGQGERFVPLTGEQRPMLNNGMGYLRRALAQHPRMRPGLRAAVVYALAEAGDKQLGTALDQEWSRRKDLEPEALAMTGLAMLEVGDGRARQLGELLVSEATHSGDLAYWKGSYVPLLDADYENDAEATAYAMRLLTRVNPTSPLLDPAAQWLMLARNGGAWWDSTEQTAMVVFGLVDYLANSHELESDFDAEVLVNGVSVGQRHFTPADALSGQALTVDVAPEQLKPGANTVQIVRESGHGRVYWSTRGKYYSVDKKDYQAGTLSLNLTRDYFRLQPETKGGKVVYKLQPLSGTAQIGDVLAVHERIVGSALKYMLLEDPIAAGTEFVQNEDSYEIEDRPGGWSDWYTRREFHDDHAAFFSTEFSGRQEIFYLVKVVNPGRFHISPARVQAMYQPGVQATSDALQLQILAPPATGTATETPTGKGPQ